MGQTSNLRLYHNPVFGYPILWSWILSIEPGNQKHGVRYQLTGTSWGRPSAILTLKRGACGRRPQSAECQTCRRPRSWGRSALQRQRLTMSLKDLQMSSASVCTYVYISIYLCVFVYVVYKHELCSYVYVYVHVHVHEYMYIYIYMYVHLRQLSRKLRFPAPPRFWSRAWDKTGNCKLAGLFPNLDRKSKCNKPFGPCFCVLWRLQSKELPSRGMLLKSGPCRTIFHNREYSWAPIWGRHTELQVLGRLQAMCTQVHSIDLISAARPTGLKREIRNDSQTQSVLRLNLDNNPAVIHET